MFQLLDQQPQVPEINYIIFFRQKNYSSAISVLVEQEIITVHTEIGEEYYRL